MKHLPGDPGNNPALRQFAFRGAVVTVLLALAALFCSAFQLLGTTVCRGPLAAPVAVALTLLAAAIATLMLHAQDRTAPRVLGSRALLPQLLAAGIGLAGLAALADGVLRLAGSTGVIDPLATISPPTALTQIVLAIALALFAWHRYFAGQLLAMLALVPPGLALLAMLYGASAGDWAGKAERMSALTAIGFSLVGWSLLALHSDKGIVRFVTASHPGGIAARKLLPAAIFAPTLLGWLRLTGEHRGLYDTEFGLALMVGTLTALLVTLILRSAARLGVLDAERRIAQDRLADSEATLRMLLNAEALGTYAVNMAGHCTYANPALARMLGYQSSDQLVGNHAHDVLHHSYADGTPYPVAACHIYQAARENAEVHIADEVFWRADGTAIPVEYWSYPIRQGTSVVGAIITVLDLSERRRIEEQARINQELFAKAFRSSPLAISVSTLAEGRFIEVNDAFVGIFGHTRAETIGRTSQELGIWYDPADRANLIGALLRQGSFHNVESQFRHREGNPGYVLTAAELIDFGGERCVLALFTDITERKRAEARVQRLNRTYAMLSATNAVIIRGEDRTRLFSDICHIAVEKGGFRLAAISAFPPGSDVLEIQAFAGHNDGYLEHVRGLPSWSNPEARIAGRIAGTECHAVVVNDVAQPGAPVPSPAAALSRGYRSLAALPLLIGGETAGLLHLYSVEVGFFDDDEVKLLREMAADVAFAMQHISQQERLDYLAYYDALTGLPNRTLFRERLRQYVQSARHGGSRLALVLVNVERFREINDSLGPRVGDRLLVEIARRLTGAMPEPDKLARVGGDLFAAVFPGISDASDVLQATQRHLLGAFREPFRHGDWEVSVSARVGIALYPSDSSDEDTLFQNAEAAVRGARNSVDHCRFYAPEMNRWTAEKLTLEHQLRRAVENREFVLYYQPKFGITTARITGFEALLRWNSPIRGLVAPDHFIPLLEETGLIVEVGRWVMEQAAIDHRRWAAAGLATPRIAVNVSALQLRDDDFVGGVERAIRSGGAPVALDLELTESLLLEDFTQSRGKLARLRMGGMRISMDDFGSGYSSLKYLSSLPIDSLKIDRDFIGRITSGDEHRSIVGAIISMAHSLHLPVVAEGVETNEQLEVLRELGCDEAQGYLFARPQPATQVEDLLRRA